ncbi:C4-dicarboxylate transporter DctA [Rhodoplanes sp. TEM]|uniref:C4-dicarboxylate transporter DctA n=1 Tax=Rhodoplanes tepidamans TaxID=200616 RepID=A0ABT5J8Z5_RHOTP|nr:MULTISPECIES: C4-dicarboxylate transporter DctA [Rhodoplanes]MDC7786130.1 C4-dicarboxylate transporter DctA [Rhodoplanes tepidamans]MDC7982797.1 C4-dicarboxylate transporter DctA [Rhodoplanes sp. TEM]MDQ0357205.1 Na+/H+-dicarboxylate symporter [Rhodoplanes tepidamans]
MTVVNAAAGASVAPAPSRKAKPFYKKMYVQVIAGVILGSLLAAVYPNVGVTLQPLGMVFIKAIKMVITPIIFLTIVVGIAKMGDMHRVANVGAKALIYFEVASTIALLIGIVVINVWPIGSGIHADPAALDTKLVQGFAKQGQDMTMMHFLMDIIPSTFVDPFAKGNMLQVVFVATLFGFALVGIGEKGRPIVDFLDRSTYAFFGMVKIIMTIAPLAAFGAMAFTVSKFGTRTLIDLGQLILGVYLVSILFVVVVLGGFLRWAGFSIWQVLSYFKDEWLFCLAATSGEAMLPRCMEKLEKLGVSREVVGLVMPSGMSFNTDGTAIYMTMGLMFMAHALDIEMSIWQQLSVLFVMLFTSKGAAGVAGAGFVALAATMPTISDIPVGALALLIGADSFMSQIRAATNLMGNVIATLVVGRWVGGCDTETARRRLASGEVD